MKLRDAAWGALLALLGGFVLFYVQRFPRIPGQNVGPAMFPGLVAAGLFACGALLIVRDLAVRRRDGAGEPWLAAPDWLRSRPRFAAFVVFVAANVFYLLVVDRLGFLITATVYLAALMAVLRVRLAVVVPVAVLGALAIHVAFYKLLRVPLPWGVLERFAW